MKISLYFLFVLFQVLSVSLNLNNRLDELSENCEIVKEYKQYCYEFNYVNDCWPWKTHNCDISRKSRNNANCISFHCPVSFLVLLYKLQAIAIFFKNLTITPLASLFIDVKFYNFYFTFYVLLYKLFCVMF